MTLSAFTVFLTVVEEMNFTRAAERLYISQQALSGYIKRLEDSYGVTLFQRKPTLKLTAEGEAMVMCARQIIESENSLTKRLADITKNNSAVIRFGISYQRSNIFFPGILNHFQKLHPKFSIRLHEQTTGKLLEELQSNRIEVMVGIEISKTANLTIIPLMKEHIHCVLNEDLLKQYYPDSYLDLLKDFTKHGVKLSLISDLPMLLLPEHNRIRSAVDQLFMKNRIQPNIALEGSRQSVLFEAACSGFGVAVVNSVALYQMDKMQRVLPQGCHSFLLQDAPVYTVSLAFRNDFPQPKYIDDFVRCIQTEFNSYSDQLSQINV